MSGLTEDLGSPGGDAAVRRLYDPAFKLFGRTIPVSSECNAASSGGQEQQTIIEVSSVQDVGDETPESEDDSSVPDELGSSSGSNDGGYEEKMVEMINEDLEDATIHITGPAEKGSNDSAQLPSTEEQGKGDESMDQAPKRPDKPVPCPRCHSLDTKFCYFNNYNVNQPRHFCKNCQRYWTAGGTLRNVPVGAGRRKNKHSTTHTRNGLPDVVVVRSDPPENAQQLLSCSGLNRQMTAGVPSSAPPRHALPLDLQPISSFESPPSSAILSFGQESPVCNISTGGGSLTPCRSEVLQGYKPEMSQAHASRNISAQTEQRPHDDKHYKEVSAAGVCIDADTKHSRVKVHARQFATERPLEPEAPFNQAVKAEPARANDTPKYVDAALAWAAGGPFSFMGGPWPYGASLGWGNTGPPNIGQGPNANASVGLANVMQGTTNLAGPGSQEAAGGFAVQPPWASAMGPWSGALPWPLMQNPLWVPPGWGGPWTMPWAAPFTAAAAANPDLGATILGKHSRESGELDDARGGPLLVPKTLRIDDPGEAARSSIWSTLGIDLRPDCLTSGGMFRDLQSKAAVESKEAHVRTRNSNPAAMNRSLSFQENNFTSPTVDLKEK